MKDATEQRLLSSGSPRKGDAEGLIEASPRAEIAVGGLLRDELLLKDYLEGRRLSLKSRDCYIAAIKSFSRYMRIPLEEADRPEFEEWYKRTVSSGLAASSIVLYTYLLGRLLQYGLIRRGLSKRDAQARVAETIEGVPLIDLRREASRRHPNRDKLVDPEEIEALIEAAIHPRVKALIALLYESGCRKTEILSLRIRDVTIGDEYTEIRVLGKTGERTLPLVKSVPYLKQWLESHPDPRQGAPLFATVFAGEVRRMNRTTPNRILNRICERTGIRHIHPHMLRHTRLTELAKKGLGEYLLKSFAGWTPDSNMAARYIHLSGRTHIPAILRTEGIKTKEAEG